MVEFEVGGTLLILGRDEAMLFLPLISMRAFLGASVRI